MAAAVGLAVVKSGFDIDWMAQREWQLANPTAARRQAVLACCNLVVVKIEVCFHDVVDECMTIYEEKDHIFVKRTSCSKVEKRMPFSRCI